MVHRRLSLAIVLISTACASKDDAQRTDGGSGGTGPALDSGGSLASDDAASASDGASSPDVGAGSDAAAEAGAGAIDGGDAGAAGPCATARFCEDFESYDSGKPPGGSWKVETNLGAVSVATDRYFDGKQSAKFTTQAGSGGKTAYIEIDAASVFPVPGNTYYGRMMSYLESAPDQSVHWTFIQAGGVVPGQTYHSLYRYGGQQPVTADGGFVGSQLMANYDTPDSYSGAGPSSDCWNHSKGVVVPVGRWACVEWQFDGPNDTMHLWLDGKAIDSLTVAGTGQGCVHQPATFPWSAPKFADLELGWESYQADSPRTLYLDDVVIATERVGCPSTP